FLSFMSVQAQNLDQYVKGKTYTIDTITVRGIKTFSDQTVISYSQLRKGQKINNRISSTLFRKNGKTLK
ncbi:MAG: hypothetical protein EBX03_15070, partial [Rhodobacteraceae bacterium]|nr:hypothetical protein [Paracoccaceae bacterium]